MRGDDETAVLRRRSLLIAIGCVIADGIPFVIHASDFPLGAGLVVAGVAVLVTDLALALPARTAGSVAVAHAVVRLAVPLLLLWATGQHETGMDNGVGLVFAAYRAGAWVDGRRSWAQLAALIAGMFAAQYAQGYDGLTENVLLTFSNTFLPWLLGRHTTGRSGYIAEVRRKADEQRRTVALGLAAAVEAERTAIARDLHDTISHHVSAMGVHAAAARLGMETGRGRATASLEQVEASSRAALADLRRMLDLLHGEESDGVRQPGLHALDELVEGSRRAGLAVNLRVEGLSPHDLPDSVNLATYRIVQEILTNASRHGDGTLDLSVVRTPTELRVTACNGVGNGAGTAGTGRGVDGIRHRAGLFGGSVTAGPEPDGTWRTSLSLPLPEAP
ncbi:sensor histidine kinase [Cryptosporangium sp. NPDC051539]|uniref:sensor histidine kinase n=1 Tax=Cryptosporangium sp. NPDC051539 TaxID=3363962 RepID=UPI0037B1BFFC